MKELRYQEKAIKRLIEMSVDLLQNEEDYQNLVFKAPTGSGKTIMATQVLSELYEELAARGLPEVAYVWIAPQKLHLQSFEKLKKIFAENRRLTPILYDDIDPSRGMIQPGEILFVNWESVNKDTNLMVRERESADSFFEIIDRTRREGGHPIYLIVDEEHRNWSKNADKSLAVVNKIHPKVELRISATPKTATFHVVEIPRREVIEEQMIKKGIYLNEDIEVANDDPSLNMHLLHKAIDMREKIAKEYRRLGVRVSPLLLIQLPNDSSVDMSSEERTLKDSLVQMLKVQYDITIENGKLGIWLSGENTTGPEIADNDDLTQVLLFKQAIALGWDCPRAAVLLIFRNLQSEVFTVQTLGRILRMPEQHFYTSDILNVGHVYTDISRDQIMIASEDSGYISKDTLKAERRESLNNITLPSYHLERRSEDQNRLGVDFKRVLLDEFAEYLGVKHEGTLFTLSQMAGWTDEERKRYEDPIALLGTTVEFNRIRAEERNLNLNVPSVNVKIPKDLFIQNDEAVIDIGESMAFARSMDELNRAYNNFCRRMVIHARFEPKNSAARLAACLNELMSDLFNIFEVEVPKTVLSDDNQHHNVRKFTTIIQRALSKYAEKRQSRLRQARERAFKETIWEVPEVRFYNGSTNTIRPRIKNHALMPFIGLRQPSTPEQDFTIFLEENTQFIDWWYKNGDDGMTNYSIPYVNIHGEKSLFYVDFIIRMKNGQVFLFDTKSEDSDPNGAAKHNALLKYMKEENGKGMHLDGGVIIEDMTTHGLWKYSTFQIENTHDTSKWRGFYPDQYK